MTCNDRVVSIQSYFILVQGYLMIVEHLKRVQVSKFNSIGIALLDILFINPEINKM